MLRAQERARPSVARTGLLCAWAVRLTGTREPVTAIPQTSQHHTQCLSDSHLDSSEVNRGPLDQSDQHEDLHHHPCHQPGPGHRWRHQQAVHHL